MQVSDTCREDISMFNQQLVAMANKSTLDKLLVPQEYHLCRILYDVWSVLKWRNTCCTEILIGSEKVV